MTDSTWDRFKDQPSPSYSYKNVIMKNVIFTLCFKNILSVDSRKIIYSLSNSVSTWSPLATAFNSKPSRKLNLILSKDGTVSKFLVTYLSKPYLLFTFSRPFCCLSSDQWCTKSRWSASSALALGYFEWVGGPFL